MKSVYLRVFVMVVVWTWMGCLQAKGEEANKKRVKERSTKRKVWPVKQIPSAHCQHPKWSHDGEYLAYEVHFIHHRVIQLEIFNWLEKKRKVIGSELLKLKGFRFNSLSRKSGMVSRELSWSPSGKQFLFSSNGTGSVFNIFQSNEGRLRTNSKRMHDGQPAWSADGKRIVFTSGRTGKGDLYWFNMEKMNPKRLTYDGESTEFFPVWSPTNILELAYVRHTDQEDRIHLISNVLIRKSRRLTKWKKKVSELNPSWSPDGKSIAFFTVDSEGMYDLYFSNRKGATKKLAHNVIKSDQFGPAWSPDGKKIFFVKRLKQNRDRIYMVDVLTRKIVPIRTNTLVNNELSVTKRSDGKWYLAFTSQGIEDVGDHVYRKLYVVAIEPNE